MLHTANGIYFGDLKSPIKYEDFTVNEKDSFSTIAHKTYQSLISDNDIPSQSEILKENPLSIELENVKLFTNNQTITMPSVEIFVDQIIGFSIGSL